MALNQQVWIKQILEGFYPDDSFLKQVTDYSNLVENNKLHFPSAGIDPNVLINNSTYPITIVGRDDSDNEISLCKFETENTLVRRPDAIEYSYDKLESVIGQHRATLRKSVAMKAIHAFAPQEDTKRISCCGPLPMMKAISKIAKEQDAECDVSLENLMACGIGACLCCVEDTKENGHVCVCTEGPIFNTKDLKW